MNGARLRSARRRHDKPQAPFGNMATFSGASARLPPNAREIAKFRAWGFAVRGRKPKPAALRLLEGNPGRRPVRNEPQPHYGAPARPRFLDVAARREWDRLAQEMARLKLLTVLDAGLFTVYCTTWSHWVACERVIAAEGMTQTSPRGIVRIRPEVRLALRYAEQLRGLVSDFGLCPTARTRLDVPALGGDMNDDGLLG